jgi:hypothetical protein
MNDRALSDSLHARLDRLERTNRRYRFGAVALGLCAFAWVACGIAPQAVNELAAGRFVLRAADGSEKGVLELDSQGNPALILRNGSATALLTTNGPSLLLRGPDGKTSTYMGIDPKNDAKLELTSARVLDGVRLVTHEDGSSGVYVLDPNGRERAGLESYASGGSALNLRDGQGVVRSQFALDANSIPNLLLLDAAGVRRIGMVVQPDGNGILELADERGRGRALLATAFDGSPRLEMKREDGGTSFTAP